MRECKKRGKPSEEEVEKAIAALIANTGRVKRKLNLLEVAAKVDIAREGLGSLQAVSETIDISVEMLRQFTSVKKLSSGVKKLIVQRKIESVDIAHCLSKLKPNDQLTVAREVVANNIDSHDVRAIVSLRKTAPKLSIGKVIERVKGSRNIKKYVAEFLLPSRMLKIEDLRPRFAQVIGDENIFSLDVKGPVGILTVNSKGRRRLQDMAKSKGWTKRELIHHILGGEVM